MPRYYPIYLDVQDRLGLVFGGNHEGERKVKYLLDCGSKVTLFSPEEDTTDELKSMAANGDFTWVRRRYEPGDLEDAWLAIVADTSSEEINQAVYNEAKERNIVLNVMDVTPLCTFIAPAIIHRNDVTVAVSTAGTSPALARRLREEMTADTCQCLRWANVGPMLADVRREVRSRGLVMCPEKWQTFMTPKWLDEAENGNAASARKELVAGLESVACEACAPYGTCQRLA
ncbi:MAG: bifunctional precorrin-2 dehydrogenase/sirohydrochlorin ferrochelatase [Dehalococcoidia bacterium]